jgi:tripartite-type tricarboxylate transporter receptor subunit TctC
MEKWAWRRGLVLAGLLLAGLLPRAEAAVSFEGKTVRFIVGSPSGGGTDLTARLLQRALSKYVPGNPTIIVQNMPGASGVVATNYFAMQAPADGLTLLVGSTSEVTPDVVRKNPVVHYDPLTFQYIGGFATTGVVVVANKKSMEHMKATGEPINVAQVGSARTGAQIALWGAEYLGWKIRWISGYAGSSQLTLAMLKGESDLTDTAGMTQLKSLLADNRFAAVAQMGQLTKQGTVQRRGAFPEVPLFSELVGPKLSGKAVTAFRNWQRTNELGKYFALPPKTPPEIVQAWRHSFAGMEEDPDFKEAASAQLDPDYNLLSHQETLKIVQDMAAIPEEDLAYLIHLREKYGLPGTSSDKKEKKEKTEK